MSIVRTDGYQVEQTGHTQQDSVSALDVAQLSRRQGPAPHVYPGPPQHQLDQLPTDAQWQATRRDILGWRTATPRPSMRSVPGTIGLHLPEHRCQSCDQDRFLIGSEFAHHHPSSDGGLHMVLPPDWHTAAIKNGWAIPHPLAGQPTVSPWTLLVYAPRDDAERKVVMQMVAVAERFALG